MSSEAPSAVAAQAISHGDLSALEQTLAADANVAQYVTPEGWSLLHLAAYYGHSALVKTLLAHGASAGTRSTNSTANMPLHAAIAGAADHACVKLLLAGGAGIHATGGHDVTPLHLAASRNDRALCELLLALGADPRARMEGGSMPHQVAHDRGHVELGLWLEGHAAP
jgi:ankyrin repeat protein